MLLIVCRLIVFEFDKIVRKSTNMRKAPENLLDSLSENIKSKRKKLGISQEELAHRCGLHRTYVGAVERGERNVTLSSLEALAAALETSSSDLISVKIDS